MNIIPQSHQIGQRSIIRIWTLHVLPTHHHPCSLERTSSFEEPCNRHNFLFSPIHPSQVFICSFLPSEIKRRKNKPLISPPRSPASPGSSCSPHSHRHQSPGWGMWHLKTGAAIRFCVVKNSFAEGWHVARKNCVMRVERAPKNLPAGWETGSASVVVRSIMRERIRVEVERCIFVWREEWSGSIEGELLRWWMGD